jgi:hypothetical protein
MPDDLPFAAEYEVRQAEQTTPPYYRQNDAPIASVSW